MKLKITPIFLLIFTFSQTKSQTIDETKEWLKYNLEKYYSSSFDVASLNHKGEKGYKMWGFYWEEFDYFFEKNFFIIEKTGFSYSDKEKTTKETYKKRYIIDLKLIKKIENVSQIDTTAENILSGYKDNSKFSLKFSFYENVLNAKSVQEIDLKKDNKDDKNSVYYYRYYFTANTFYYNLKENLPDRIVQALHYLVEKYGGKIIKDIF